MSRQPQGHLLSRAAQAQHLIGAIVPPSGSQRERPAPSGQVLRGFGASIVSLEAHRGPRAAKTWASAVAMRPGAWAAALANIHGTRRHNGVQATRNVREAHSISSPANLATEDADGRAGRPPLKRQQICNAQNSQRSRRQLHKTSSDNGANTLQNTIPAHDEDMIMCATTCAQHQERRRTLAANASGLSSKTCAHSN